MAATVQLNIQTNEAQVRAQLQSLQQQLNQMTSRQYNVNINLQLNSSLTQQLNTITGLLTQIRNNQNLHIQVGIANANNVISSLNRIQTQTNNVNNSFNTVNNTIRIYNRQQQDTLVHNNILVGALRTLGHVLIHEVRAAFNSAFTEMKAVDTELITIQKVTGDTAEGMKRYANDAYEVAARLGAGASEYLNAVAEFAKAGYQNKSKELGELAITAAKVGDTTQSMANQFLLSVDAAYKYEGSIEKLTAVLDGANEIGNRFPTSVEKIAQGLGKVSPIAAQAHVGIDELTAAIGTITAVTQRSGNEAATALRALYLNIIGDTKTEIEDGAKWTAGEIEGLRDLLRKYAGDLVKAADETGKVINPMEAIRALYLAMKEGVLTEQELMAQVSDIGGKLRSSQLLALIQNFDKYEQMLETYRDSAGSAAEEYAIYLDSWEAKTKQLSATWTDFVQNQLGTDRIKKLLDTLINVIDSLDEMLPLIKGIGIAIAALNLNRIIANLVQIWQRLVAIVTTGLGPLGVAIGVVAIAIGALQTKHNKYIQSLEKAAEKSKEEADYASQLAKRYEELAGKYEVAEAGSSAFETASKQMVTALENEGRAVKNLVEDYRALTLEKLQSASAAAGRSLTDAENLLTGKYEDFGNTDLYFAYENSTVYKSLVDSGALSPIEGDEDLLRATNTTPEGILAYYNAVYKAREALDKQADKLRQSGRRDEAAAIAETRVYRELSNILTELETPVKGYESAYGAYTSAKKEETGYEKFLELTRWIDKDLIKSEVELQGFLQLVKDSTDLSDQQKNILDDLARRTFPQYAEALDEMADSAGNAKTATEAATTALEKFKEATKKGSEKDDPFKDYKGVYDTVIKEGKAGRYGSNAFQYGIAALLDPSIIKQYEGNWDGLITYMQKSLGGLYKDADSMGTGLLDAIWKEGEKTKGKLSQIKDESGEILASFDKKTGDWYISDKPEDIKKLATKLGMSAESLVAAGIALGAIDPNAETGGLKEALDVLLGRKTEEDPTVTAMNASAEAQNASAEAQKASADAEQAAADALNAVVGVVSKFFGGNNGRAGEAGGIGTSTADSGDRIEGVDPVTGEKHVISAKTAILSHRGTGYSLGEDKIDGGGRKSSVPPYIADRITVPAISAEEQKRVFDIMMGNVLYGMSQGDMNRVFASANGITPEVTGAVAEGVEEGIKASSGSSEFHGTGKFVPYDEYKIASGKDAAIQTVTDALYGGVNKTVDTGSFVQGMATFIGNMMVGASKQMEGSSFASTSIGKFISDNLVNFGESLIEGTLPGAAGEIVEGISQIQDNYGKTWAEAAASGAMAQTVADLGDGVELDVAAVTEGATTDLEAIMAIADEIEDKNPELVVDADTGKADAVLTALEARLDAMTRARTIWINVKYSGVAVGPSGGAYDTNALSARPTGDESFHGGPVLVNDQAGGWNPELIVANGRAFIANGGDPTVLNLPRGARIFNADETRDIFNGGEDLLNFPAFAKGNAKDYLRKNRKKSSGSSGSGGSSSSSDGSTEFTDDMMKKLEQYMSEILDAAEDALNDQLEAINAQIYALKYQTEAAEKATALEEARLQLLEAEKNLLDANTERTVRYYNAATGQWEWMADQRKVMQAQEELYDAQKNLLEAEYDALATAWSELKDEIKKALENNEPIDINAILAALGKSAASGSLPGLKSLISDIFTYTEDPRAVANFDGGGLASGLGWMPKGTRGTEAVLDSALTKMVLNPQTNAAFTGFTDSLATLFQLAGGNGGLPSSRFTGNVSNLYGGNTYIEGVRIGSDMMNRPLSEVLSTLNLYKNN